MRTRIEAAFGRLGRFLHRRPWWVIACIVAVIGAGATQIPNIEFQASADSFLRADDPVRQAYDRFLEQFGRDDTALIAIEPPEVFDLAFLAKLRRFHEELEDELPHVHEVLSLINARYTRGEGDRLIVGELFEDWPENDRELAVLRELALANPLYLDHFLSRDATLTTVVIELEVFAESSSDDAVLAGFADLDSAEPTGPASEPSKLTSDQERAVVTALTEVVARYDAPDFRIYAAGSPVMNTRLIASMMTDVARFTALSIVVIALVLGLVFRRAAGIVVPLLVAILALLATAGAMGTLRIPFMPVSEIVPSFLLSVGVGGTVHLLVIFLQRLRDGATREDALAGALSHSGLPVAMTSLTTAAGLSSFAVAGMVPIAVFGVVAPMGVLLALALTLFLAPALMAVVPLRALPSASPSRPPSIALLTRCGDFATRRPGLVLAVCAVMVGVAVLGIVQLQMSHNALEWFPDDEPVKIATRKLNDELAGAVSIEFLVETQQDNGLYDPALLRALGAVREAASHIQVGDVFVGKSVSLTDVVEEIHQALNGGDPASRSVPDSRRLVAQELLLFENSGTDDLEDFVDTRFSMGRITMKVPFADGSQYLEFGTLAKARFEEILGDDVRLTLTGVMAVMGRTFTAALETVVRSYVIALCVITPLMIIVLGSLRLGLIAMIPNLFPIVLTLGVMGWIGVPLEMFSLLIGSVALGLAVDDTIHFMHGFRRSYEARGSIEIAVRETLQTTGQALLFTSAVLSLGFFIYVFSDLTNLTNFGALTAFAICMAFVSDILMAPALLTVLARFSSLSGPPLTRDPSPAAID